MDKKTLESYRSCKLRVEKLQSNINELKHTSPDRVFAGKVKTSMSEYPYIECNSTVECDNEITKSQLQEAIKEKELELANLVKILRSVEDYIKHISDPTAKTVLEYYYIDGDRKPTQKEVAKRLFMSRENVAQIIFKCA